MIFVADIPQLTIQGKDAARRCSVFGKKKQEKDESRTASRPLKRTLLLLVQVYHAGGLHL